MSFQQGHLSKIFERCYLDYVGLGVFKPKEFSNPADPYTPEYNDPDADSQQLYVDLCDIYKEKWGKKGLFIEKLRGNELYLSLGQYSYTMGSDYIGPSRAKARAVGINPNDVGIYLKETRIIGGHILWPKTIIQGENKVIATGRGGTINTARGGVKGFCDRIDCSLEDIKRYYNREACKLKSIYDKYADWLMLFEGFREFVDFFWLNCFCSPEYEVWDLSSYCLETKKYEKLVSDQYINVKYYCIDELNTYSRFIEGNTSAILERSQNIRLSLLHS